MNKKQECPICKRILRTRGFVFNRLKQIMVCKMCDKRIGNNKFYIPKEKRKQEKIGNFNMTTIERQRLYAKHIKEGKSPAQAGYLVARSITILRNMKRKRKYQFKEKKNLNEEFVKGLITQKE